MMHPHAIDHYARGERIAVIDYCLRQFMTPAAILKDLVFSAQTAQKPRRRRCSQIIRIPADEDMPGSGLRYVFDSHCPRWHAIIRCLRKHRVVPDTDRARVIAVSLRVNKLELIEGNIGRRGWTAKHGAKLLAFRLLKRLRAIAFRESGGV